MIVTDRKGRKRREPDDYVLRDGESTHTSMLLMDAYDSGTPIVTDARGRTDGLHAPGPRYAADGYRARDDAYDQFIRELGDAWRSPRDPEATPSKAAAGAPDVPTAKAASRQAAYDAYVRDLANAWRNPL